MWNISVRGWKVRQEVPQTTKNQLYLGGIKFEKKVWISNFVVSFIYYGII